MRDADARTAGSAASTTAMSAVRAIAAFAAWLAVGSETTRRADAAGLSLAADAAFPTGASVPGPKNDVCHRNLRVDAEHANACAPAGASLATGTRGGTACSTATTTATV